MLIEDPTQKRCNQCNQTKPLEAFRASRRPGHKCPEGLTECRSCRDSYCKNCRRIQTAENRPRESARWNRYRKSKDEAGEPYRNIDADKKSAWSKAQRVYKEPKQCEVHNCTNRGERHHPNGHDGANALVIIWLCRIHHSYIDLHYRFRERDKFTHYGPKAAVHPSQFVHLDRRVRIKSVAKVERTDARLMGYIGKEGKVIDIIAPEWHFGYAFRIQFDDGSPALNFQKKEIIFL